MSTYFTKYVPLNDSGEELEIEVRYTLGGQNFWSGGVIKRGLKLYITPVKRSQDDGCSWKQYRVGDDRGRQIHLLDLNRKSDKQGQRLAKIVETHIDAIAEGARRQEWHNVAAQLWAEV